VYWSCEFQMHVPASQWSSGCTQCHFCWTFFQRFASGTIRASNESRTEVRPRYHRLISTRRRSNVSQIYRRLWYTRRARDKSTVFKERVTRSPEKAEAQVYHHDRLDYVRYTNTCPTSILTYNCSVSKIDKRCENIDAVSNFWNNFRFRINIFLWIIVM